MRIELDQILVGLVIIAIGLITLPFDFYVCSRFGNDYNSLIVASLFDILFGWGLILLGNQYQKPR